MKLKNKLSLSACILASLAAASSASAQLITPSGITMTGTNGRIANVAVFTVPSALTWTTPNLGLANRVVPVGQFTGFTDAGVPIPFNSLIPLGTSSIQIIRPNNSVAFTIDENTVFGGGGAPASNIGNMAQIPAGTLTSLAGVAGNVAIATFKMSRTELTFGEWYQGMRYAASNGYTFAATTTNFWDNGGRANPQLSVNMATAGISPVVIKFGGAANNEIANSGGHSLGGADHPVVGVNWYDVLKWSNASSQMNGLAPVYYNDVNADGSFDGADTVFMTGEPAAAAIVVNAAADGVRLPTESEWEWAARGGNMAAGIFPWGTTGITGANANYSASGMAKSTTPVGSFPAGVNAYGLHDMAGNVWEWCFNQHPTFPALRVVRGGSWNDGGGLLAVSSRSGTTPDGRLAHIGLRVVRN